MKKTLTLAAGSLALMGLVACTAPQSASDTPVSKRQMDKEISLEAYHWRLFAAADKSGQPLPAIPGADGKQVTLNFTDRQVSVDGLCNLMSGGYTVNGSKISITQPVSTM